MPDIIPGARPTRMELIALRKRRNIAQRGQDLLREKLDALMIEFFQFAREITALRTKTQVNSLEYIVIPRILNTIRYIEMSLQERAREDFFRLKRIKTRLEEEEEREIAPQPLIG